MLYLSMNISTTDSMPVKTCIRTQVFVHFAVLKIIFVYRKTVNWIIGRYTLLGSEGERKEVLP
ncbi:hypothetical protein A2V82_00655 [candidate division KSB1 bacterium RBG_16_48_16]|nr:MAG: hypothetical protein A2V82_00655 [candidate division KSB1 bacterium RBG_16_48_16]